MTETDDRRPESHRFVQTAYYVPDVHAAAAVWVQRFGAGPFFVAEHIPLTEVVVRGPDESARPHIGLWLARRA